ncbi:MAG TPA: GNAT family N-acetyltransferase [Prolixibacteraceae bacterium]|nr:GNAT family N-acetyltransferase [Prolixibacteraceae bacterium]HUM88613.1 GNAT family N-acetyltransferase [Prolixibacteraceae bacterium]
MNDIEIITGDLRLVEHRVAMLALLEMYMLDPMGDHGRLTDELAEEIVLGLESQPNYLFFLAKYGSEYVGLANCFVNFSTFKAKKLVNIHDFAVSPKYRKLGIGEALMRGIFDYSLRMGFCKVTLEVRHDNEAAQKLYKKMGFKECNTPMYFWEYLL